MSEEEGEIESPEEEFKRLCKAFDERRLYEHPGWKLPKLKNEFDRLQNAEMAVFLGLTRTHLQAYAGACVVMLFLILAFWRGNAWVAALLVPFGTFWLALFAEMVLASRRESKRRLMWTMYHNDD